MAAQTYKPTVGDTILLRNASGAPYKSNLYISRPASHHSSRSYGYTGLRNAHMAGRKEVMRSDHIEALLQDVAHVVGKCKIWSLEEWLSGKADQHDDAQFFSRYLLKAALQKFVPDRVPGLCSCCLPLNPDIWMLECTSCGQWYHPDCIGLSEDAARKLVGRFCCGCQTR